MRKCALCNGSGVVLDASQHTRGVHELNTMSSTYARSAPPTKLNPFEETSRLERDKLRLEMQKQVLAKQCERLSRELGVVTRRQRQIAAKVGRELTQRDGNDEPVGGPLATDSAPRPASSRSERKWRPRRTGAAGSAT
jgi:hypothetical protein